MNGIIHILLIMGISALVLELYLSLDQKHFLLTLKYEKEIKTVLLYISFATGFLVGILVILSHTLINLSFELLFCLLAFLIGWPVLNLLSRLFWKKNRPKESIVLIKKGSYTVESYSELIDGTMIVRNRLKTVTSEDNEMSVLINGIAPKGDQDIYLKCYPSDSDSNDLIADQFLNKVKTKFEWFDYVLTMYVLIILIVSIYAVITYPGPYPIPENLFSKFPYNGFGCACSYMLFRFGYFITKDKSDTLYKIIHFISGIYYYISILVVLLLPLL